MLLARYLLTERDYEWGGAHLVDVILVAIGEGDSFNLVVAAGLAEGAPIEEAARSAVVAASLSVAALGARAGMPTLK